MADYPKGYNHRRGCSRTHPIPFPCDNGTPVEEPRYVDLDDPESWGFEPKPQKGCLALVLTWGAQLALLAIVLLVLIAGRIG